MWAAEACARCARHARSARAIHRAAIADRLAYGSGLCAYARGTAPQLVSCLCHYVIMSCPHVRVLWVVQTTEEMSTNSSQPVTPHGKHYMQHYRSYYVEPMVEPPAQPLTIRFSQYT